MNPLASICSRQCEHEQHDRCRSVIWNDDSTPFWFCPCDCHKWACGICHERHGYEVIH